MINFLDKVNDTLSEAVGTLAKVSTSYPDSPAQLPYVMLQLIRVSADQSSYDERLKAPRFNVSIQVDVFAQGEDAAFDVDDIYKVVHEAMENMKFVLEDYSPMENYDRTISRSVARYSAKVAPELIGDDKVYQIYRR